MLLAVLSAIMLFGSAAAALLWPWPFGPKTWRDVKPGMTVNEVRAIMGEPDMMSANPIGVPLAEWTDGHTFGEWSHLKVHYKDGVVQSIEIGTGP
jgi:hypothetical protein